MKNEELTKLLPHIKQEVWWMISLKAGSMGLTIEELLIKAVQKYSHDSNTQLQHCSECGEYTKHKPDVYAEVFPLTIGNVTKDIVIENVPTMKCECGNCSTYLALLGHLESVVDQITEQKIRNKEELPTTIDYNKLLDVEV